MSASEQSSWTRIDDRAREVTGNNAAAGWEHGGGDLILTRPTDDGWEVCIGIDALAGSLVNRNVLFRSETPSVGDRLSPHLEDALAGGYDLDAIATVRAAEMEQPNSLIEWAHTNGAEGYSSEKIGNTKQSSGTVARFSGSHRWGNGAYIARASVNGPGGDSYISIGTEPDGHYTFKKDGSTVRLNGRRHAYEMDGDWSTRVTYGADTITIERLDHDKNVETTYTVEATDLALNE